MEAMDAMREFAEHPQFSTDEAREVLAKWAAALIRKNAGDLQRKGFDAIQACAEWLDCYDEATS